MTEPKDDEDRAAGTDPRQGRDEAWSAFLSAAEPECAGWSGPRRVACLAYWYEAEVYNGGHLQYFKNSAGAQAAETVDALRQLGADKHADVLLRAVRRVEAHPELVDSHQALGALARRHPFDDIDEAYWACEQTLEALLAQYLDDHLENFIEPDEAND